MRASHIIPLLLVGSLVACGGNGGNNNDGGSSQQSSVPPTHGNFAPSEAAQRRSNFCTTDVTPAATTPFRFEQAFLETQLANGGLAGTVHGVMSLNQQYVFTYRSPDNFFSSEEINLVPADGQVAAQIAGLKRHDAVTVQGTLLMTGAGPRHLLVASLSVNESYANQYNYNYAIDETIFDGLETSTVFGKVHALINGGEGLVLEYQDMVLPVIVDPSHKAQVASFYRDDIISIDLSIIRGEGRPLHFRTDPVTQPSISVIDKMVECHTQVATLTGELIRFPPSPSITREVYAVRVTDDNGIARNYTFFPGVGFSDPNFTQLFNEISAKAAAAWQTKIESAEDGRNYFVNPNIRVTVSGAINVTSPNQANPQVYITDVDSLVLE